MILEYYGLQSFDGCKKAEDAIKESKVSLTKKIEEALKVIDELEISFDMIFHDQDRDHIQVGYDIQTIKKILEK